MLAAALAFSVAAALLTITPGLDTMFVVRTSIASGPRTGMVGGLGVCLGTLVWATASAVGVTAILLASQAAYDTLRAAGAAYLTFVGARMLWHSRKSASQRQIPDGVGWAPGRTSSGFAAFRTGLLTNLLNPKVGVFYITLLPQFVPKHAPVLGFSLLLASIHAVEGIAWFAMLTAATARVFIAFGARLAVEGGRLASR